MKPAARSTRCATIPIVDSDDPEQRIRELERRLADAKGGLWENVARSRWARAGT
jgi:hypothetical protein